MAKARIHNAFQSFMSWISQSLDANATDNASKICWIFHLPPEILQTLTEYLNVHDIISLSKTCRLFYTLINDDNFWIHRIHYQFPSSIAMFYTSDLFQEPENILTNDEIRPSGFDHIRVDHELDIAAIKSATHYNDEAIEKRHAKMYTSKKDFLTKLQYFQFKQPNKSLEIPNMKLIYFYLIDRKRTSVVDMNVIHRNSYYLVEQNEKDSLTGRIIRLQQVCWLEISGRFEYDIMPGKYEVIWRMKSYSGSVNLGGETEFTVVPSSGKMLIRKISENDFQHYILEHGNHWFLINMGHIVIYEISTVFMGIRNWHNGNWKTGISWDCIELKLIA
ncbi:unnamed protein product [Rotaria sp. Silwood1]|nr:unnamed protein product [Rotaria sp. Silwood1]CAF1059927.1 unnamed protein product [Rotaria sp. Silwood1]CAF1104774.1 unnamed protein product [Rotaria sp. Silwood1]CAF3404203.1 unnamed protein product [Rotaria sp. Silwood1]CAF3426485.1 unnamed protein product [Rotaria sp. Silwood1]